MSTIVVGPICYAVKFVDDLHERASGTSLMGEIDHVAEEIRLLDSLKDDHVLPVLWHEVLHAINNQGGFALTETQVTGLAYQIAYVLQGNPELINVDDPRKGLV